ncbi:MAG TPA: Hsp70 family protein [Armatimonadota bacterium]|nr:Hsp70 family protein [Armatimonadota bacterium]
MKTLYTIGIDFGTSNSCVCYASYNLRPDGMVESVPIKRPEALSLQHADTIPTVIFLGDETGQPTLYGEIAEERAAFYPELTRSGFKLDLGRPGAEGAEAYSLTRQFLGYLRSKVADYIPMDGSGDECQIETVIGHPVQWTADQREETLRAAIEAGFPNVQIEGESMAAVYCHLCETGASVLRKAGSLVMMVDMGGGTTDFAFLKLSSDPKESPISTPVDAALLAEPWGGGRRSYGGRDLDALLLNHFLATWGDTTPPNEQQMLMREMRRFKERFSTNLDEGIDLYQSVWLVNGEQKIVRLEKVTFEQVTAEYRAYFHRLVDAALSLAEAQSQEVSAIILTGGHSRWYFIEDVLREKFPHIRRESHTLLRHNHPEQSVARGLCYQRMILAQAGENKAPRRKATHSIWVGVSSDKGALEHSAVSNALDGPISTLDQPVLVIPEGQLLPYRTGNPVSISVQRLSFDSREPTITLRLYSGLLNGQRVPLIDRTARFQRGLMEGLMKQISRRLPWATNADEDRYVVDVFCKIDENEMLSGKVVVTRYWRDRVMAVQTQPLKIDPSREARPVRAKTPEPAIA